VAGLTRRGLLRVAAGGAGATLAGVLGAGLAGCGLVTPARGGRGGTQLILLADLAFVSAAQALAAAFAASASTAPQVIVQVALPSLSVQVEAMLGGDLAVQPDLFFTTPSVRDTLQADTLMLNLGPALNQTGLASTLYPMCLEYGLAGARQLVLPVFRDPLVVFYNSDAFARAGVDPPGADWDLDRFNALCGQLQDQAHGLTAPLANATRIFDLELFCAFVLGYGGEMLKVSQTGYAPLFASGEAAAGCGALASLRQFEPAGLPAGKVPRDLFAGGQAALYFGHHSDVAPLAAQISDLFAWDVAPLPAFPLRRAQPLVADGVSAVTVAPERRSQAIALALFACTTPAQLAMAGSGAGVPALQALATSPAWQASGPSLDNSVFVSHTDADFVVQAPLYVIAPALQAALQDTVSGYAAYDALVDAATYSAYQLANWQD